MFFVFIVVSLQPLLLHFKQGVALTGRNTTGPPSRAAPGELRCICAAVECYRRRQTPESKTILAPYTMYRRASNKCLSIYLSIYL